MILAPLIAAALIGVASLVLAGQRASQRRLVGRSLGEVASHAPAILSFTGESCTVCHVAQRPAIARLCEQIPGLEVREVDVARDPEAARAYRVMTLPTTVVLDDRGRVAAVNAGFASEAVLRRQIEAARPIHAHVAVACT